MPRLEKSDGRFWEIALHGKTVQTRSGFIGSDGRPSAKRTFPTLKAAQSEASERVKEQLAKGYVQRPVPREPVDERLAEAIAADPVDPGPYLVYADWLQGKRHPRGELIALQSARQQRPDDKKLREAEEALLAKHPKLVPERLALMTQKTRKKHPPYALSEVRWENGFIASARLARFFPEPNHTIRELLVELLEHPAGRFLRELELGVSLPEDGISSYAGALNELERLSPPTLRRLSVVAAPIDAAEIAFTELGPLGEVMRSLPALEVLNLAGRSMVFDPVSLPKLRVLSVAAVDTSVIPLLAFWSLPALEELRLDCGDAPIDEKLLAEILSGTAYPRLRKLELVRTAGTDALVPGLSTSAVLPKLQTLSLAHGRLSNAGAAAVLAARGTFQHLAVLDLSGNEIANPPAALQKLCPEVRLHAQRGHAAAALTAKDIATLAPNAASLNKARALARPSVWSNLGRDGDVFWGQCQGSELYDVSVRAPGLETTCTCFARAYAEACKHAVALALLVMQGERFAPRARPQSFGEL
jgi:uncharacterized protein (TIGR02996 family)